jgi:hypothetical protein
VARKSWTGEPWRVAAPWGALLRRYGRLVVSHPGSGVFFLIWLAKAARGGRQRRVEHMDEAAESCSGPFLVGWGRSGQIRNGRRLICPLT